MFTLAGPIASRSLPLALESAVNPRLNFPRRFPCIVHVRAKVSSVCDVIMSSQSFDLAEEYDIDVMGGNLREARGIDNDVAFLRRDPVKEQS